MLINYLVKKINNIAFSVKMGCFFRKPEDLQKVSSISSPTLSDSPDTPESFGYKVAWLAIKTNSINNVVTAFESLNFSNKQVANWHTGMQAAYYHDEKLKYNHLFISPPLDGWVFVVGWAFDDFWCSRSHLECEKSTQKFMNFVQTLKQHHILNFYYFFSYRVSDCYCWSIIEAGHVKRIYAEFGDEPYEQGEVTPEELQLGYRPYPDLVEDEASEEAFWYPTEATVMKLATAWSINTETLEERYPERLGVGVVLTRLQTA